MLDDVAVYAVGALSPTHARRVRDHLASCEACAAEYAALAPTVALIGMSQEACPDAEHGAVTVSPLLKARIMRRVRSTSQDVLPRSGRSSRSLIWPAYLVAAACFAIAIFSTLLNLSLMQQLKSSQTQVSAAQNRSSSLARSLVDERTELADIASGQGQRFAVPGGQIVRVRHRLYLTLHDLALPAHGKIYQAWTLPKGSKLMAPSTTFVPDSHGSAIVALPVNADITSAVAVSVEPEGGSKQPTSKPILVQSLE